MRQVVSSQTCLTSRDLVIELKCTPEKGGPYRSRRAKIQPELDGRSRNKRGREDRPRKRERERERNLDSTARTYCTPSLASLPISSTPLLRTEYSAVTVITRYYLSTLEYRGRDTQQLSGKQVSKFGYLER